MCALLTTPPHGPCPLRCEPSLGPATPAPPPPLPLRALNPDAALIDMDSAREPLVGKEVDLMSTNRLAPRANVGDAFEALQPLRSVYQSPSYQFPRPLYHQWLTVRQCLLCMLLRMSSNATLCPLHADRLEAPWRTAEAPHVRDLSRAPSSKEGPFKRSSDGDAAAAADGGAAADGAVDVEQDQNALEDVATLKHTLYCVSAPLTVCV